MKKKCCNKWKKKGKACKSCPIQQTLMERGYIKAKKVKPAHAEKAAAHKGEKLQIRPRKAKVDPVQEFSHGCLWV